MPSPSIRLSNGEAGNDFLGGMLSERGAVAELLQLPAEHIAQLRFLIDSELVFLAIANGACRKPLENDLDLVLRTGIGSRFGRRRESPAQVERKACREFLELARIKKFQHCHKSFPASLRCALQLAAWGGS